MKDTKKNLKLLKSLTFIVSLILIFFIILIQSLNYFYPNSIFSNFSNGITTELLGILVTVGFIELLFNRKSKKEEEKEEREAILRANKIIEMYLIRYEMFYFDLVKPRGKYNQGHTMPLEFEFKDLQYIYLPHSLLTESIMEPAITVFYDIEKLIRDYLISTISKINFKFHNDILQILIQYINISVAYDARGYILNLSNYQCGDKTAIDFNIELIKKCDNTKLIEYLEQGSNVMIPYIFLYKMLNTERDLIIKYRELIDSIR